MVQWRLRYILFVLFVYCGVFTSFSMCSVGTFGAQPGATPQEPGHVGVLLRRKILAETIVEATFACNVDLPAWIGSIIRVTCWTRVNKFRYALSQLLSLSVSSATPVQGSGSSHSLAADLIIVL